MPRELRAASEGRLERVLVRDYLFKWGLPPAPPRKMLPVGLAEIRQEWRRELFSTHNWNIDTAIAAQAGEAGGYRVVASEVPQGAYLKPTRLCDAETPRAANEKIVSDLAFDLGLNVPPNLLYRSTLALVGEESRCCVSLVMYPEQYPWGMIWDVSMYPQPVQEIIRATMARYSETFALDLLIGQTDRNNVGNVILGMDSQNPGGGELVFLDHAFTLNYGARWSADKWKTVEMVPVPELFRSCINKNLALAGAARIEALTDAAVREIVCRIPEDYISEQHREIVVAGLNGRKRLLRDFIGGNL
jgi:hypothetical protein